MRQPERQDGTRPNDSGLVSYDTKPISGIIVESHIMIVMFKPNKE